MKREELLQYVGKPLLRPLGILQMLLLLLFIASPFVGIWYSWSLAWRLALTGLIGTVIVYWVCLMVEKSVIKFVDNEIKKGKDSKLEILNKK